MGPKADGDKPTLGRPDCGDRALDPRMSSGAILWAPTGNPFTGLPPCQCCNWHATKSTGSRAIAGQENLQSRRAIHPDPVA